MYLEAPLVHISGIVSGCILSGPKVYRSSGGKGTEPRRGASQLSSLAKFLVLRYKTNDGHRA